MPRIKDISLPQYEAWAKQQGKPVETVIAAVEAAITAVRKSLADSGLQAPDSDRECLELIQRCSQQ